MRLNTNVGGSATLGLDYLMRPDKFLGHIDNCKEFCRPKKEHPFGLDAPVPNFGKDVSIAFVGAHGPDVSVKVFLANIRHWVGGSEDQKVVKLRVISTPFPGGNPGQHYVFFEIQTPRHVLISGETADCNGGGNQSRRELEDVFTLLASVYEVEIERVTVKTMPELKVLYESD